MSILYFYFVSHPPIEREDEKEESIFSNIYKYGNRKQDYRIRKIQHYQRREHERNGVLFHHLLYEKGIIQLFLIAYIKDNCF